ncbi:MAG: leucine-rich repeat protein [Prevotella sp.]|nr:leucine-rich repeat protein [Prevotella sp.]
MKKYILLSLLLALAMTKAFADEVAGFDGPTWYDYRADSYAGGNGNENNPYLISTPAQLAKLAYEVNVKGAEGYYKLTANISLNERVDGERVLWVPIGISEDKPFKGTLTNPDGYVIEDMIIRANSTETTSCFGLFGYVKEGTVDGIIMKEADIRVTDVSTQYCAGLICGELKDGNVKNCEVQGYITAKGIGYLSTTPTNVNFTTLTTPSKVCIGGLVGRSWNLYYQGTGTGSFISCVARVEINIDGASDSMTTLGAVAAGGVVGLSYGPVVDCHSVLTVTAKNLSAEEYSCLGGVVGYCYCNISNATMRIWYCSASGDMTVEDRSLTRTGGLIGCSTGYRSQLYMKYCATSVTLTGGHTLGGMIGQCYQDSGISNAAPSGVRLQNNLCSSYIDARNATYAGGFFGEVSSEKHFGREYHDFTEAIDYNFFFGTMVKPTESTRYGTVLGYANYKGSPTFENFSYSGEMCNLQTNGMGYNLSHVGIYDGTMPDADGYSFFGINWGGGLTSDHPERAALSEDHITMCYTDNYIICGSLFYITNDRKTLYNANDVTIDFSIEDVKNSSTGERKAVFTVPDDVKCVKVVDKHLYPLDPGEVVVTVKWNGLQRKVHLYITYGQEWNGGSSVYFDNVYYDSQGNPSSSFADYNADGSAEKPYLIHTVDQLNGVLHTTKYNKAGVHIKLANDIFFNTHLLQEDGTPRADARKWDPVDLKANLDGNGKTIYGLYVNKVSTAQDQSFGLFANLYGSVENLAIVDSHVEVDSEHEGINVGMLCGSMKDGASVSNCLMHGNVVSDANRGGLCGNAEADNISITDIFSCVHVYQPGWPQKVTGADYSGGVACNVSWDVMERCFSTGRVEDYSLWNDGIVNTDAVIDCYYDAQMLDWPGTERDYALTTKQILSRKLYEGKEKWQQQEECYPMLKTFADTPYGKLLAIPVLFDGLDDDAPFFDSHYLKDDWAGNVNYIFEFPTEDVTWSALHDDTYIDVINDCGAASLVKETGDDVEMLIGLSNNTESMCTRAMRTLPLNIRSGLTSFRFKDPIAQTAAGAAFDKEAPLGTLTLRELVEATKNDFAVFNSYATGLQYFPEFRYFTATTTLEEGMLSGLDQLSELQLPKKLQTIDTNAFNGCTSLEEITLPTTFSTLNEGGLYGSGIKNVLVNPKHETMESIDGALFETDNDGKLHLVAYPPGRGEADATISAQFNYIDDYAFYKIPELRNIYIDNCLPDGNLVIPTKVSNPNPIIHENANDKIHVFVNDGSYDSRLFWDYEGDSFWGGEYYDTDHLHIYYPLNMTSAGWATLYIGFPTQLPEGFNAYVVKKIDEEEGQGEATLKNIGRVIPGTVPVVIKNADPDNLKPGVYPLTRWDGEVPDVAKYNNRLVGTYIGQEGKWGIPTNQETSITGGTLTLGRNSKGDVGFYKYNGKEVPPYRAYLPYNTIAEGAKGYSFIIDDTIDDVPTGIQHPTPNIQQSTTIYDISGRKLSNGQMRKGIYIINGKKVVIK